MSLEEQIAELSPQVARGILRGLAVAVKHEGVITLTEERLQLAVTGSVLIESRMREAQRNEEIEKNIDGYS